MQQKWRCNARFGRKGEWNTKEDVGDGKDAFLSEVSWLEVVDANRHIGSVEGGKTG